MTETTETNKKESRSLDFYKGFLAGSHFDYDFLLRAFDIEELEPHLDELADYCNTALDILEEQEQKEKCSPYNYFIYLMRAKNKLDLNETIRQEPFIYMRYKGLIKRTYFDLTEKELTKEELIQTLKREQEAKKKTVKKTTKKTVKRARTQEN